MTSKTDRKQIRLPAGFGFRLRNAVSGKIECAPRAFEGYDWRMWEHIPDGIEYEVAGSGNGPNPKIIRWDSDTWEPTLDWAGTAWPVEEVA